MVIDPDGWYPDVDRAQQPLARRAGRGAPGAAEPPETAPDGNRQVGCDESHGTLSCHRPLSMSIA